MYVDKIDISPHLLFVPLASTEFHAHSSSCLTNLKTALPYILIQQHSSFCCLCCLQEFHLYQIFRNLRHCLQYIILHLLHAHMAGNPLLCNFYGKSFPELLLHIKFQYYEAQQTFGGTLDKHTFRMLAVSLFLLLLRSQHSAKCSCNIC